MNHKGFERDIKIGTKQFSFYEDISTSDIEFVIGITNKGYHLIKVKDSRKTEISRNVNLSLDKLNKLLPSDMQLSKDHIIYVLTADIDK